MPATETDAAESFQSSAAVVALIAGGHRDLAAAKLLVRVLGVPQVIAIGSEEPLPRSVQSVVYLDDKSGRPDLPAARTWRLADAPHVIRPTVIGVPADLLHHQATVLQPDATPLENAARLTWYYAAKRWRKMIAAGESPTPGERNAATLLLSDERDGPALIRSLLGTTQVERNESLDDETGKEPRHPDTIFRHLARIRTADRASDKALTNRLQHWLGQLDRVPDIAWVMAAAHLMQNRSLVDEAVSRLLMNDLYDASTGCIRSKPHSSGFCYSPLLAAVLLIARRRDDRSWRPRAEWSRRVSLPWRGFSPGGDPMINLVDPERRRISRCLFDNWVRLHTVPKLEQSQYELTPADYRRSAFALDDQWLHVLRRIILDTGTPFVRLHPWPADAAFAMSLRYDIDRPTSCEQARAIVDLQRRHLGAACGSWYAIPGTDHLNAIASVLDEAEQEIGVHLRSSEDDAAGVGVTCHSAPTSEYWRGAATVTRLEDRRARYAEMLGAQLGTPRPAWIESIGASRPTVIPLTPLHFPIEGTTADTSLAYFDQLLDEFRRQRECGGHLIIGGHPDLNQSLLETLLRREQFDGGWCATVGDVVERCRRVQSVQSVEFAERSVPDAHPGLMSDEPLDDLRVSIDDGSQIHNVVVTLKPRSPVPLELSAVRWAGSPRSSA